MFRNPNVAHREKELAELKAERDRLAEENDVLREDLEEQTKEKTPGWFQNWMESRRVAKLRRAERGWGRGYGRFRLNFISIAIATAFIGIAGMIGVCIWNYATDIQEGVVTSKAYHPPTTTCATDGQGYTTCINHPESWSVDIAYEGQTATWTVSQREHDSLQRGQWYCYTDVFHSQTDCQGEPHE